MKISVIGGGAWGTTLAQLLVDNGHDVLIYEINPEHIDAINNQGRHPFFNNTLDPKIKATNDINKVTDFANYFVLSVPTKAMRIVLKNINKVLKTKSVFINVSKGIEPETSKRVSEIVSEEIDSDKLLGFVALTGPSHAEEVIERKVTLLVAASADLDLAVNVQQIFANPKYMRIYTSNDLIGAEVGGAVKNAIAVISGICTGLGLGENARAALISRGILEIIRVVEHMGGRRDTAFGLTGIGDLIVTASSENSRNFQAGKKIGQGVPLNQVFDMEKQTIEGVRTIDAVHQLSVKHDIDLPMINTAYEVLFEGLSIDDALEKLLNRTLKVEEII